MGFVCHRLSVAALLGIVFLAGCSGNQGNETFSAKSILELEQQLAQIDKELETLARFSLRNEVGAIGHRSLPHRTPDAKEWIQIDFGERVTFDSIVLVPSFWRDPNQGFRDDGFPVEFKVIVGGPEDSSETILASYSVEDNLSPRLAPLIVSCDLGMTSWIRIEATRLSPRGFDGRFIFQLSEVLVFNGQDNVALNQSVQTSSQSWVAGGARNDKFLVDGDVPYLMNTGGGLSIPFIGVGKPDKPTVLTIDLQKTYDVDRVQLHGIDLSDTAPRSTSADFGVSRRLVVEGANREDFRDRVELTEIVVQSELDVSPIVTRRFSKSKCRYIRFINVEPYTVARRGVESTRIGFAEIEVFADGKNVALGKPVEVENARLEAKRPPSALTDGLNLFGGILPVRDWLEQLSRRHELQVARPMVQEELNTRFASQKSTLFSLQWLAGLLVTALVSTVWISGRIRKQKIAALRKRFAADLHDELGANLYTIGLLSDVARKAEPGTPEYQDLHDRIRMMTTRSAAAIRYWIDSERTEEFCTDLVSDMQRAAERIVVQLEHDFRVEGPENLERLNSQTRGDILLFYKECLINICRHSGATKLGTELLVDEKGLKLVVLDNGRGLPKTGGGIPASLRRRAKLLRAFIDIESPKEGGTGICMTLRFRKRHH